MLHYNTFRMGVVLLLAALFSPAWAATVYGKQPIPNTQLNTTRPTIQASFGDGYSPAQIFIDGREFTAQANRSGNTYILTPNYNLDYGTHTVKVVGRGLFGVETEDTWSFTLSNAPQANWGAQIASVNPHNGLTVHLTRPTIAARFTGTVDPNATQLWVDGREFTGQSVRSNTGISWTPAYNLDAGQHRVHMRAVGMNGVSLVKDWMFTIDANYAAVSPPTDPRTIEIDPEEGAQKKNHSPTIKAVFPAGINESTTRMMVDGVEVTGNARRDHHRIVYHPTQPLASGRHKVKVVAFDKANRKVVRTWNFDVVDRQPPQQAPLQVTFPTNGAAVGHRFEVNGTTIPNTRVQVVTKLGTGRQPKVFEGFSDNTGRFAINVHVPRNLGTQLIGVIQFDRQNRPKEPMEIQITPQ